MYGYHRLGGASLLLLGGAFCTIPLMARAQTTGQTLPPVTVEAPSA